MHLECSAFYFSNTFKYIDCVDVAVEVSVLDNKMSSVLNIDSVAVVGFGDVCTTGNCQRAVFSYRKQ